VWTSEHKFPTWPSGYCHLNVKNLQKKKQKKNIAIFQNNCQNCHLKKMPLAFKTKFQFGQFFKNAWEAFGHFLTLKWQFSGGSVHDQFLLFTLECLQSGVSHSVMPDWDQIGPDYHQPRNIIFSCTLWVTEPTCIDIHIFEVSRLFQLVIIWLNMGQPGILGEIGPKLHFIGP